MRTARLGEDGPEVSVLGIGAMSFSDFYGATTDDASFAILDAARDLGISHIDTADVYGAGRSETVIGAYLAANPGARENFVIATKAGIARDAEGNRVFDNSETHLTAALEASLARLGIEAVDLFYVHRRDPRLPIEAVTETLGALVQAGKCRAIGFSEIAPSSLARATAVHPVAAVQSEYSLSTRSPELGLVQRCDDLGVALVAFSPVGRGLLSDDPPTSERVAASGFLRSNPRFTPEALAANVAATDGFRALAVEMGLPAAGLAMAWLLAQGDHVLPIPGTRSVAHLRELAEGAEVTLGAEALARIEETLPVGWAQGDRYSPAQWVGPERYC